MAKAYKGTHDFSLATVNGMAGAGMKPLNEPDPLINGTSTVIALNAGNSYTYTVPTDNRFYITQMYNVSTSVYNQINNLNFALQCGASANASGDELFTLNNPQPVDTAITIDSASADSYVFGVLFTAGTFDSNVTAVYQNVTTSGWTVPSGKKFVLLNIHNPASNQILVCTRSATPYNVAYGYRNYLNSSGDFGYAQGFPCVFNDGDVLDASAGTIGIFGYTI